MQSRGISEREVRLVHLFGVQSRDKKILTSKTCRAVLREIERTISQLEEASNDIVFRISS
jgi:cob(I)alamin adenosyltransferase